MNLIIIFPEDFIQPGRVRLTGRRHRHIIDILQSAVGDELSVGLIDGTIGTGRLITLGESEAVLDLALGEPPPEPLPITLVLAVPRPIVLKRLLAQVTALGVKKIFLIHSSRVEKSYWKSPVLHPAALREALVAGLEQAKDTIMPAVVCRTRFQSFVEGDLPHLAATSTVFVAHPGAVSPLPVGDGAPITLVIGPEGGLLPFEVESFRKAGCRPVSFGRRILRVETAVIAAVARLTPVAGYSR